MKPVKQLYRHDPPHAWGDCHRACVASILELPCEAVPNFCAPPAGDQWQEGRWREREYAWMRSQGLVPIVTAYAPEAELDALLDNSVYYNPGIYWILGGTSRNGTGHSVVAFDGRIVHDPSLDDSGIVGPMEGGHYWGTFIGAGISAQPAIALR